MRKFKRVVVLLLLITFLNACSQKPVTHLDMQLTPEQMKEKERVDKLKKPQKMNQSNANEHP